ncbi:MAG: hypothetical protein ACXWEY_02680 [Bacteroidia bacterium]
MGILAIFSKTKPAYNLLILSILLVLICLPRFNRNPLVIKRDLNDAAHYIAYVEYFRGEEPSAPLLPAFNWRPGIPFVASFLPFEPMTAINIINVICLLMSLLLLDKTLAIVKVIKGKGYWDYYYWETESSRLQKILFTQ